MSGNIQKFLAATRYAVVGASTNRAKYGNKVLRCLLANDKIVYPVHPTEEEIEGIRCLRSLEDVPDGEASLQYAHFPVLSETIMRVGFSFGCLRRRAACSARSERLRDHPARSLSGRA